MPTPEPKESLTEYMKRFMSDKADRKKWKPKQRAAIAYSEYRSAKHK
jgi:hypothetical protein